MPTRKSRSTNLTTEAIRITSTDSDDGDDVELDVAMKDGSGEEDVLSVELFGGTATSPAKFEVDLNDSDDNIESLSLANNGFGNRRSRHQPGLRRVADRHG